MLKKVMMQKNISAVLVIGMILLCCGCTDKSAGNGIITESQQTQENTWINQNNVDDQSEKAYIDSDELIVNLVGLQTDGDCTIIQCGDIQILIDTASSKGVNRVYEFDEETGEEYSEEITALQWIQQKMSAVMDDENDKVWDYVILSHPDEDHIGNATDLLEWITQKGWSVGTIIDYDFDEIADYADSFYNTATASNYSKYRTDYCDRTGASYFSAASLSSDNKVKEYKLTENSTLSILYNYYDNYSVVTENGNSNSFDAKANDVSVCCLIESGKQKLLFTGDLEENGEKKLAEYHEEIIKNVTFFKAGHHGSNTSNKQKFVDVIRPAYVAISYESKVSAIENSISNFLTYTDYIYPTYVKMDDYLYELYGDTTYYFDGTKVVVDPNYNYIEGEIQVNPSIYEATTSDGFNWYDTMCKEGKIKDRLSVYTFDESIVSYSSELASNYLVEGNKGAYINCTLIKYGHYDIVIDCGSTNEISTVLVDKLKTYAVDGVIECLIVTHFQDANISQIIGSYDLNGPVGNGIFDLFLIENLVDNKMSSVSVASSTGFYARYLNRVGEVDNHIQMSMSEQNKYGYSFTDNLNITVSISGNGVTSEEDSYSLISVIEFNNDKMLFVGDQMNYSNLKLDENEYSNVVFMRLPGISISPDKGDGYKEFLLKANPQYSVVGTPIGYVLSSGQIVYSSAQIEKTLEYIYEANENNKVYACGCIDSNKNYYVPVEGEPGYFNGDMKFTIEYDRDKQSSKYKMERVYSNRTPNVIDDLI